MQTCWTRFFLKTICLCRYFPTFFSFPLGCWLRASNLSTKSASNCTLFDVASFHFSSQLTIYLFYFLHSSFILILSLSLLVPTGALYVTIYISSSALLLWVFAVFLVRSGIVPIVLQGVFCHSLISNDRSEIFCSSPWTLKVGSALTCVEFCWISCFANPEYLISKEAVWDNSCAHNLFINCEFQ